MCLVPDARNVADWSEPGAPSANPAHSLAAKLAAGFRLRQDGEGAWRRDCSRPSVGGPWCLESAAAPRAFGGRSMRQGGYRVGCRAVALYTAAGRRRYGAIGPGEPRDREISLAYAEAARPLRWIRVEAHRLRAATVVYANDETIAAPVAP